MLTPLFSLSHHRPQITVPCCFPVLREHLDHLFFVLNHIGHLCRAFMSAYNKLGINLLLQIILLP
jgi:hypothetical protein